MAPPHPTQVTLYAMQVYATHSAPLFLEPHLCTGISGGFGHSCLMRSVQAQLGIHLHIFREKIEITYFLQNLSASLFQQDPSNWSTLDDHIPGLTTFVTLIIALNNFIDSY